jgi:cellulose synthase/poly-beta-1,6-N-acetylglucosamine synthase-like glycosyltransferase
MAAESGEESVAEQGTNRITADVTVVTATYTMDRWSMIQSAVDSVLRQTVLPREIILPVDHNPELFERLTKHWGDQAHAAGPAITAVESEYYGHLGASETTAAEHASTEFLAFLDDDAAAEPDWLEHLLAAFADPLVIAVGGAPLPVYSKPRPRWLPLEFDWVFGCAYEGLPKKTGPILHLIGTTMAVRTKDLLAIGGIRSNDHGDLEMSHRLLAHSPGSRLLYVPDAIVRHHVPEERLTWGFFWRRCFFKNRSKVVTVRAVGAAGHLGAERRFARRALSHGVTTNLGQFVRGDVGGLLRAMSTCVGLGLAGAGYATGTIEWHIRHRWRGQMDSGPSIPSPKKSR